MDRYDQQRNKRFAGMLLLVWIAFNIIQAAGMELDPDEAYYWLYSRQLDWGYFDHPPVIAILIKAGFAIIPGELGVRLGAILLQAAGFLLLWDMAGRPLERSKFLTLAALLAAAPMLQMYGFIATPDSPLLFFIILFFYAYQKFLQSDRWGNVFFLGLVMAVMLYSKYHGILVIAFTLFSNWRLLRNPRFYVASIFGAALFFPHLYWQYDQGFPSFSYHLVGRDDAYELKHTVTYLINQVAILSPFLFPLFVIVLYRRRPQDMLERAFYFVIYGFWIFFFLSTFKGHAEPQWTATISIPLTLLAYRYAQTRPRFDYWLKRMALVTLLLLFAVRLFLLLDTPWKPADFRDREWIADLKARAVGKAVIFQNSYRDVSKYSFYAKERAYTFTDVQYRKNQFDIWDWETVLQGQPALLVGKKEWTCATCDTFKVANKYFKLLDVPALQTAQKLRWDWRSDPVRQLSFDERYEVRYELYNPYPHTVIFGKGALPVQPVVYFLENGVYKGSVPLETDLDEISAGETIERAGTFRLPTAAEWEIGMYQMSIGIQMDSLPPVVNAPVEEVELR